MIRSILLISLGALIGGAVSFYLANFSEDARRKPSEELATSLASCQTKLVEQERTIVSLTQSAVHAPTECAVPTSEHPAQEVQSHSAEADSAMHAQAITWRISSIEKFLPLTDEQKERLEQKYTEEQRARSEDRESDAETLDDILGAESAATYRNQVKAAFERVQNEELEKEVLWASRKLSLNEDQERALQAAFADVEMALKGEFRALIAEAQTPAERVTLMIQENKKRRQLRAELVKDSLTPEQYQAFLALEAQSASADMEVFHEPS
jgi:paraquat-inducible protein B